MAKYRVTLGDGRTLDVYAHSEAGAKEQAIHQEASRHDIADQKFAAMGAAKSQYALLVAHFGQQTAEQVLKAMYGELYKIPDQTTEIARPVLEPVSPPIAVVKLKD
jgi:hypothetical protein